LYRSPIYAYRHDIGIAITGGAFYNPDPAKVEFPQQYVGSYFFSDLGGDWIHRFDPRTGAESDFASDLPAAPVGEIVDPSGSLYYLARGSGTSTGVVARIDYEPQPTVVPPPVTVDLIRVVSARGSIERIVIQFSDRVKRGTAQDPAAYWLILPGPDRELGTSDDRRVRIRVARYNGTSHTVKLDLNRAVSGRTNFAVVVSGSASGAGVIDVFGRPIDGDQDGQPGGNHVEVIEPVAR
jgi:hypothetical protein